MTLIDWMLIIGMLIGLCGMFYHGCICMYNSNNGLSTSWVDFSMGVIINEVGYTYKHTDINLAKLYALIISLL